MKVLKRGSEFRKVSERNIDDVKVNKNLIAQGWEYCSKKEYKDATRTESVEKPKSKKSKKANKK